MKTYLIKVLGVTFVIFTLLVSGVCQAEEIIPPDSDCGVFSEYRKPPYPSCEPIVMVIRHAEDIDLPDGTHALSASGKIHADLYQNLFEQYMDESHHYTVEKCACEIDKIIAIHPKKNLSNDNPSSNPYETIKPLSTDPRLSNIPIEIVDVENAVAYGSNYEWTLKRRLSLLNPDHQHSTVIAWDKQGLNASDGDIKKAANWGMKPLLGQPDKSQAGDDAVGASLLETLPLSFPLALNYTSTCEEKACSPAGYVCEKMEGQPAKCFFLPGRNDLYVLSNQGKDGKFEITKFYQQLYSNIANAPKDDPSWYRSAKLNENQKPLSIKRKKN